MTNTQINCVCVSIVMANTYTSNNYVNIVNTVIEDYVNILMQNLYNFWGKTKLMRHIAAETLECQF